MKDSAPDRSRFARRMARARPRIAFYYGNGAPLGALAGFDAAVVEPGFGWTLPDAGQAATQWLAYVSLGEALEPQPYFGALPREWLVGENPAWESHIIDQEAAGWPEFLAHEITHPLLQAGYDGVFLDTVDAYLRLAPGLREGQQAGAANSIVQLRKTHPRAVIVLNRGFELLPEVHAHIDAIAFESLYSGWDEAHRQYVPVHPRDRQWLLSQSAVAQSYGLPVIAIDYCPPRDVAGAQTIADRIRSHNIVPFVGDGHLLTVPANTPQPSLSNRRP